MSLKGVIPNLLIKRRQLLVSPASTPGSAVPPPQPVTWGWHADGQASRVPEAYLPLAVVPELQRAERESRSEGQPIFGHAPPLIPSFLNNHGYQDRGSFSPSGSATPWHKRANIRTLVLVVQRQTKEKLLLAVLLKTSG